MLSSPLRAYWGYHQHLALRAQKLFDSLDPQLQRHINEEKVAMEKGSSGGDRPASSLGVRGHKKAASQDLTESGEWPAALRYWTFTKSLWLLSLSLSLSARGDTRAQ